MWPVPGSLDSSFSLVSGRNNKGRRKRPMAAAAQAFPLHSCCDTWLWHILFSSPSPPYLGNFNLFLKSKNKTNKKQKQTRLGTFRWHGHRVLNWGLFLNSCCLSVGYILLAGLPWLVSKHLAPQRLEEWGDTQGGGAYLLRGEGKGGRGKGGLDGK